MKYLLDLVYAIVPRKAAGTAALLIVLLFLPVHAGHCGPWPVVRRSFDYKRPLSREEFRHLSLPGIGDRQNTWTWSMIWYKGKLYAGTNRAWHCVEIAGYVRIPILDLFLDYPPDDPDMECTPDPLDLPLQAEIWTWSPEEEIWERVYQAPLVEIPGHPGHMTGRDVGYRDMVIFPEADGTEALYVMGVTQNSAFPNFPPPRILRTVDGRHFEPVPQDPGTFLGDLNRDNFHSSFRAPSVYKGRLFLETGTVQGNGELIEASDPARGNDAFRLVLPEETRVYITTVYNGYLYVGIQDPLNGFQIVKTLAEGEPPYELTPVVENGGFADFVPLRTSGTVLYSYVHEGMLFAGTDKPSELLRIHPDDTWDLVVGMPRMSPDGFKYPLSGYGQGFNSTMNHHIWRMGTYDGWLYIGTADASTTNFKDSEIWGPVLEPYMGFDLFATQRGYYMYEISRNGFDNKFNLGIRAFVPTEYGLFFGAANNWYGTEIWWGRHRGEDEEGLRVEGAGTHTPGRSRGLRPGPISRVPSPERLEAETLEDGTALLSWDTPPGNFTAVVYGKPWEARREPYRKVAVTGEETWTTETLPADHPWGFRVRLRDPWGRLSAPTNVVVLPNAARPVTCDRLMEASCRHCGEEEDPLYAICAEIRSALEALRRNRLRDEGGEELIEALTDCHRRLEDLAPSFGEAREMEILLYKFLRRCRLVRRGDLPSAALFTP